jgi:phosphatidate phosphatase APP1
MRTINGFSVGQFTPENVLRNNGLDSRASVDQLIAAAAPHDTTNPGYLSQAELQRGADDLLVQLAGAPTTTSADSFSYSRKVLGDVKQAYLTGVPGAVTTDAELVATAGQWDDGNGYLKKAELEAGAMELQTLRSTSAVQLTATEMANIAAFTGSRRKGAAPPAPAAREIGVISDIDKTVMQATARGASLAPPYPGVAALYRALELGNNGQGALGDITYVTARNPSRVVDVPQWMVDNNLPAGPIETGINSIPAVAENEKVRDIERVVSANPDQSFVLFGDTSHRDPDVYQRIQAKFPNQVKAVIMHDVKTIDPARTAGQHVVTNYAQAAATLFKLGVIDEANARVVMAEAQQMGLAITNGDIDQLLA